MVDFTDKQPGHGVNGRSLRIMCAITHTNELTLDLCQKALYFQTVIADETRIISAYSPICEAYNEAFSQAMGAGADLLVVVPADCILERNAIATLLKKMDRQTTYCVTVKGFDFLSIGNEMPAIAYMYNMGVIADKYRFRDSSSMEVELFGQIEADTGMRKCIARPRSILGYHHPIWTARELFCHLLYVSPKMSIRTLRRRERILLRCLDENPSNNVLKTGIMALRRGMASAQIGGSLSYGRLDAQWRDFQEIVPSREVDYFAYHCDMVRLAGSLIDNEDAVNPMAGDFFDRAKWNEETFTAEIATPQAISSKLERFGVAAFSFARSVYMRLPESAKQQYRRAKIRAKDTHRRWKLLRTPTAIENTDYSTPLANRGRDRMPEKLGKLRGDVLREPRVDTDSGRTNSPDVQTFHNSDEQFGSWQERWRETDKRHRVLLVAPTDYAGSMYKWAEAINRYTDYAARLVCFRLHQYGYPNDILVRRFDQRQQIMLHELADEASILHLKDEFTWYRRPAKVGYVPILDALFFGEEFHSKPKVFTLYGGYARSFKAERKYIDHVSAFDARIAMTPDLNYDWVQGSFIPHTIDTKKYRFGWSDTGIFAHSPSSPQRKGTYIFQESVQYLKRHCENVWRNWTVDLISDVSFNECLARKRKAALFFDQAGRDRVADVGVDDVIGWYGNSAIEAMVFGIPTIAHISETALERGRAAGVDLNDIPVINIERKRQSMVEAFLIFANSGENERYELAMRTRNFVDRFHGYPICGGRLAEVYGSLVAGTT